MEVHDGEESDATIITKGFIHNYLKNDGTIKLPTPALPGGDQTKSFFNYF
jgi:hypothetical protein